MSSFWRRYNSTTYILSRVCSDQGVENILVARHMIEKRGSQRHSIITGASTHNQRIERLMRDMHKSATILYYKLFYFMEHIGLLDPLNEHHLWALHYVYLPRISKTLHHFTQSTTLSAQLATNLLSSCSLLVLFCYKIHIWKHLIFWGCWWLLWCRQRWTYSFRRGRSTNSSKLTTFFIQWFSLSEIDHWPWWSLWQLWNGYIWTDSCIYSKLAKSIQSVTSPSVQASNAPAYIVLWTFD